MPIRLRSSITSTLGAVGRIAVEPHVAADPHAADQIVQPIDAAQQRRFAAARRADQGGDLALGNAQVDVVQGLLLAVPEVELHRLPATGSSLATAGCVSVGIDSPRAMAASRPWAMAGARRRSGDAAAGGRLAGGDRRRSAASPEAFGDVARSERQSWNCCHRASTRHGKTDDRSKNGWRR